MPDTVDTVIRAPDDGWRYHLKHIEQFKKVNQSHYRPEVPRGFQEFKVPRLHVSGTEWC